MKLRLEVFDWKQTNDIEIFKERMFKINNRIWCLDVGNDSVYLFAGSKKPTRKDLDEYGLQFGKIKDLEEEKC